MKVKLLTEAFILLDKEGPEGVTIRAVARAAGVSHAAPANHFADLKHLLTEMAQQIFDAYLATVDAYPVQDAKDRARAYLIGLYDYAILHPARYDLLWRKDLVDWENPSFYRKLEEAYRDFLGVLDSATKQSGSGVSDVETLGTAAWSMIHGFVVMRSTGIFESRTDAVTGKPRVDAMLDLLLGTKG
ncbi:MAG: TetR/AcrR family transcriptional regulator [Sphingopyxis sp.]|nr:TetR/AcrR family transcriptional regulator [Sphingopyxis sp.]